MQEVLERGCAAQVAPATIGKQRTALEPGRRSMVCRAANRRRAGIRHTPGLWVKVGEQDRAIPSGRQRHRAHQGRRAAQSRVQPSPHCLIRTGAARHRLWAWRSDTHSRDRRHKTRSVGGWPPMSRRV